MNANILTFPSPHHDCPHCARLQKRLDDTIAYNGRLTVALHELQARAARRWWHWLKPRKRSPMLRPVRMEGRG